MDITGKAMVGIAVTVVTQAAALSYGMAASAGSSAPAALGAGLGMALVAQLAAWLW